MIVPYYADDLVTIYHGDMREWQVDGQGWDHVLTDPPFASAIYVRMRSPDSAGGNRRQKIRYGGGLTRMKQGAIGAVDGLLLPAAALLASTPRWVLVFSDVESIHDWRAALVDADLRYVRTGAWVKPDAMPQMTGDRPGVGFEACTIVHGKAPMRWNGGGRPALWTANILKGNARDRPDHECPKPLGLMRQLVRDFTDPGEVILDPFAGSGTTLVAAKSLGRRAIGIEIRERDCETAARRCSQEVLGLGA